MNVSMWSFLKYTSMTNYCSGKGCEAQRALFDGGTIENGKVAVQFRQWHGRIVRQLVAMIDFAPHSDVTCYGGLVQAPANKADSTHAPYSRNPVCTEWVAILGEFPFRAGDNTVTRV